MSLSKIRSRFGPGGIIEYPRQWFGIKQSGLITDDTQMTLFTAEGLIRAANKAAASGTSNVQIAVYYAYLRWLLTQKVQPEAMPFPGKPTGWLYTVKALHHRRAPGNTCLSALRSGIMGTADKPINNSKGCGGIMRAAPAALIQHAPFKSGCDVAAITHGHPSGYLAAGVLASIIHDLLLGTGLIQAVDNAILELKKRKVHQECLQAIEKAMDLAKEQAPSPEAVESLGAGWIAEEALAMSIYCALTAEDFRSGVVLAVNHGGDSDSTGSITGNILGALYGKDALPTTWLANLELREVIEEVARDAVRCIFQHPIQEERDLEKYPPY